MAQRRGAQRRAERPLVRTMDRHELRSTGQRGLNHDWSPDQMAGRIPEGWPKNQSVWICATTICSWIEKDEYRDRWKSQLRPLVKRPQNTVRSEHERIGGHPEVIDTRGRLGDLEGDTVIGTPATGGLTTMVYRFSWRLTMTRITHKHADHVAQRLNKRLKKTSDQPEHSIKFDNGTEFAGCHNVAYRHPARLFFARPGCPRQRGTNESKNVVILVIFPKGTEFNTVSGGTRSAT